MKDKRKIKLESEFQSQLIKRIKLSFPDSILLKNNPNYKLGFPDWTLLGPNGKYVIFECKRAHDASRQALQDYYIDICNKMSMARFVSPENEDEFIDELHLYLNN